MIPGDPPHQTSASAILPRLQQVSCKFVRRGLFKIRTYKILPRSFRQTVFAMLLARLPRSFRTAVNYPSAILPRSTLQAFCLTATGAEAFPGPCFANVSRRVKFTIRRRSFRSPSAAFFDQMHNFITPLSQFTYIRQQI